MKIDLLTYLQNKSNIRIYLSGENRKLLVNKVYSKYGNIKNLCKKEKLNYHSAIAWFTNSKNKRREPSFSFLNKICNLTGDNLENYVDSETVIVGSGHSFQNIPRFIEIDDAFHEGFGLYYGDGQNKIGTNEFAFSNTNFNSINYMFDWFEQYFKIQRKDFKIYIYTPSGITKEEAYNKAVENLKIDKLNIRGVYHNNKSKNVHIIFMIKNSALKYIFDDLSKDLVKQIDNNPAQIALFIKGYLSAEGNVYTPKKQKICQITIGFGNQNEFELIKKYLKIMNIEYTTSHNMNKQRTKKYPKIEIHKKDSILRLHKISGFGTNLKRQESFDRAIKYIGE